MATFDELGMSQELLKAIETLGFEEPTPIQAQSIPPLMEGRDIIAQSPTGTGKTFAFGIPILDRIDSGNPAIQALILCPTRELVLQTTQELQSLARFKTGIGILPIYGGQQIERQMQGLRRRPQIIIATPGRMMDHLRRKTIVIHSLTAVVLDEADEMLDMGFREDIDAILETVPKEKQMILFSATVSKEIMDIANRYQKDALLVKLNHRELTVPTIAQYYVEASGKAKIDAISLLIEHNRYKLCLVFCNTKRMVDELALDLNSRGYSVESLHGDMRQIQRDRVMKRFREGEVDILVATDVAARGIDVENIDAVFNYDIPSDEEYYVHRIGRTGRANRTGAAYTFATGRDVFKLKQIMRYTRSPIKLISLPTISDIHHNQATALLKAAKQIIEKDNLNAYIDAIENMINDDEAQSLNSMSIAAALLKAASHRSTGNRRIAPTTALPAQVDRPMAHRERSAAYAERPTAYSERSTAYGDRTVARPAPIRPPRQYSKLLINLGRMDVSPRDLVELIATHADVRRNTIGDIDLRERDAHIMVARESAARIIAGLNGVIFKGNAITVTKMPRIGLG